MPFLQEPVKEVFNYSDTIHISACDFVADGFQMMDASDPYEAMAVKMVNCIYNGAVDKRIEMAERLAKITNADGGILFAHWGCKGTIGASGLIKSSLEAAGLPTMILDGDGCNPANTSDGQVSTRLQAFVEMLEENRRENRMIHYVCKYTPVELFRGFGEECAVLEEMPENFEQSDQIAHANLCGFGKSVIQAVLREKPISLYL